MKSHTFEAIGTVWTIDIYDAISETKEAVLKKTIAERIESFDKTYSRFRTDSLVTKMAKQKGEYTLPNDAKILLNLYKKLYNLTDGLVTPLIGDVLTEAGYDADYSFKKKTLHTPISWDNALDYKHPTLEIKKPVWLDFGAAGKGYLVDIVGKILSDQDIHSFCIDAGGDILYQSENYEPFRIGLEHPNDPEQVIGVATITKGSLCGSAGNRRTWGTLHHIINPNTLKSPTNILAVWVTAESALFADALTTCLFFTPVDKLKKHFDFEYAMVHADFSSKSSQGFPGEFFTK